MTNITNIFDISIEKRFHYELTGLPKDTQKKVIRCVDGLRNDPWHDAKQLKGLDGIWRQKVDAYRILYVIGNCWVHIYSVQHRQGVYMGTITKPTFLPSTKAEKFPLLSVEDQEQKPDISVTRQFGERELLNEVWLKNQGLNQELINKILTAQNPEALEELIDFGIPEYLFDQLWNLLINNRNKAEVNYPKKSENMQVQLIRRDVIDHFFGRLVNLPYKAKVFDLTIVSPWITSWSGHGSSLKSVIRYVVASNTKVTIVTRKPKLPGHIGAMAELQKIKNIEIVYLAGLHAKYFICDVAPIPFALLGSANVTENSLANFEIGVLVRGTGDAESFVRELQSLTIQLRSIGKIIRRRI
ncbi:hypothetical protein ACFLXC_00100 [Chloroflexota bacterium]